VFCILHGFVSCSKRLGVLTDNLLVLMRKFLGVEVVV
jgi:hypothetical protein